MVKGASKERERTFGQLAQSFVEVDDRIVCIAEGQQRHQQSIEI